MAIIERKPRVNPFGKMSIFGLFELLVFIAQKRPSFVLKYLKKTFSWPTLPKKKSWKIGHFWTNIMG